MFHRSELGAFGHDLPADLDGNVPQEGDRPDDFRWDPRTEWTPSSWSQFVEEAAHATWRAQEALQDAPPLSGLLHAASSIARRVRDRQADDPTLRRQMRRLQQSLEAALDEARDRQRHSGRLPLETEGLARALVLVSRYLEALEADMAG